MLYPKKVKFRKWHTARRNPLKKAVETRGTSLAYGSWGIKTEEIGRIRATQIESAYKAMGKQLKKAGRVWVRIFPDMPFTQKAAAVPMGSGKGDPQGYQVIVKPGRVLFELDGVDEETARLTLRRAADKLPVKTRVVQRTA